MSNFDKNQLVAASHLGWIISETARLVVSTYRQRHLRQGQTSNWREHAGGCAGRMLIQVTPYRT